MQKCFLRCRIQQRVSCHQLEPKALSSPKQNKASCKVNCANEVNGNCIFYSNKKTHIAILYLMGGPRICSPPPENTSRD